MPEPTTPNTPDPTCERPIRTNPNEPTELRFCGGRARHLALMDLRLNDADMMDPEHFKPIFLCDPCADITRDHPRCMALHELPEDMSPFYNPEGGQN